MKHFFSSFSLFVACLLACGLAFAPQASAQQTREWAYPIGGSIQTGRIGMAQRLLDGNAVVGFTSLGSSWGYRGTTVDAIISPDDAYQFGAFSFDTLGVLQETFEEAEYLGFGQMRFTFVANDKVFLLGSSRGGRLGNTFLPGDPNDQDGFIFSWKNDGSGFYAEEIASLNGTQTSDGFLALSDTSYVLTLANGQFGSFLLYEERGDSLAVTYELALGSPTGGSTLRHVHAREGGLYLNDANEPFYGASYRGDSLFMQRFQVNPDTRLGAVVDTIGLNLKGILVNDPDLKSVLYVARMGSAPGELTMDGANDVFPVATTEQGFRNERGTYANGRHFVSAEVSISDGSPIVQLLDENGAQQQQLFTGYPGAMNPVFPSVLISLNDDGTLAAFTTLAPTTMADADSRVAILDLVANDTAVYALGIYNEELVIDGTSQSADADGETSSFIAKFSADSLELEWVETFARTTTGSSFSCFLTQLTLAPNGWLHACGNLTGDLVFGTDTLTDPGAFVLALKEPAAIPVGLSEASASFERLAVFPNPASGQVTVRTRFAQPIEAQLSLTNAFGQVVYSAKLPATQTGTQHLDTRSFAPGVYFVQVQAGDQQRTQRLLIK